MGKYQAKAEELIGKARLCDPDYLEVSMDNNTAIKIALMVCDELIDAAIRGYDYDADYEIPFYEGVKSELKSMII